MAKQVEETLGKVLDSAKAEFLTLGFEKASMRNIAKAAEVTTGALYVRFPNKDALFCALVQPVIDELFRSFEQSEQISFNTLREGEPLDISRATDEYLPSLLDYIYSNIDIFRLLLNCAAGSSQEGFMDSVVDMEVRVSMAYIAEKRRLGRSTPEISEEEMHLLISAELYAIFEIVRHDISREIAVRHINTLVRFFQPGWDKIFGC